MEIQIGQLTFGNVRKEDNVETYPFYTLILVEEHPYKLNGFISYQYDNKLKTKTVKNVKINWDKRMSMNISDKSKTKEVKKVILEYLLGL